LRFIFFIFSRIFIVIIFVLLCIDIRIAVISIFINTVVFLLFLKCLIKNISPTIFIGRLLNCFVIRLSLFRNYNCRKIYPFSLLFLFEIVNFFVQCANIISTFLNLFSFITWYAPAVWYIVIVFIGLFRCNIGSKIIEFYPWLITMFDVTIQSLCYFIAILIAHIHCFVERIYFALYNILFQHRGIAVVKWIWIFHLKFAWVKSFFDIFPYAINRFA